jgi:hypothetical protein
MVLNKQTSTGDGESRSGALVIFTRVEGLLRERTHVASAAAGDPLRCLASWGVPLVFVSAWDASEIRHLQTEFAFEQPFICEEGAAVHVPGSWLVEPAATNTQIESAWEVFRFSPRTVGGAVHLLTGMFLARGYDPLLTVGIGCDLPDYDLLAAVDVPIVVRDQCSTPPEVLRELPGVYVTSATGTAGWSEAVLGVRQ